jgi:hypothetical protein
MAKKLKTKYVTCDTCGAKYPAFDWASTGQASGCAASLYEDDGKRYLSGGYGSTVCDMTMYDVTPHTHFKLGECCDICIVEMIASGLATQSNRHEYDDDDDTQTI